MEKEFKPIIEAQPKAEAVEEQKTQKYSYDDLKDIADKLFKENVYLKKQLQQAAQAIQNIDRLSYLLKCVELSDKIKDSEFINYCVDEIKEGIIIPEETQEENKEE